MQCLFLPGCWQTLQSQAPTIHSQPMDCLMQILRATDSTVDPTKCHVTMSCESKGFTIWNGLHKHRKRGRNLVSGKTSSQTQRFQKGLQRTPIQQEPNREVSTSVMSWWHSNPTCMVPLIKVLSCRGKEIDPHNDLIINNEWRCKCHTLLFVAPIWFTLPVLCAVLTPFFTQAGSLLHEINWSSH